jgi:hypothetical protein
MPQSESTLEESGKNNELGGIVVVAGGMVVVDVVVVDVVVVRREPIGRLPVGTVVGPAVVEGAAKENSERSISRSLPSKPGADADWSTRISPFDPRVVSRIAADKMTATAKTPHQRSGVMLQPS